MRNRLAVAIAALALLGAAACNPPNIYETQAGFQPRSQAYTVIHLEGAGQTEPMPSPWGLIDRREVHRVIQPVSTAEAYDMVFYEKINGDYKGGAGTYLWTDLPTPKRGNGSVEDRAKQYLEQFRKAPLVKLQPGAPDYGCPCLVHSVEQKPFDHEGSKGYEIMGFQRVGAKDGPEFGFYLAVLHRADGAADKDLHVVVLQVSPVERFKALINDARKLGRRVRWTE